jgi:amidohydrolase
LPAGSFAINHGPMMAAFDPFEIDIEGKGAHSAMPNLGIDPLVIASQLVVALQTIVSRRLSPQESAVVTVTQIHGGDAWNVIPERAVIRGSSRSFSSEVRAQIRTWIEVISSHTAAMHGGSAKVTYGDFSYPPTVNSNEETEIAIRAAKATVGASQVNFDCEPSMASEDFSYMLLAKKRGAYIWMGADGDKPSHPLHSPHYDFNDDTLAVGMRYWVNLVKTNCNSLV